MRKLIKALVYLDIDAGEKIAIINIEGAIVGVSGGCRHETELKKEGATNRAG